MSSEKYEIGLKIRKEVLGEDYVDNALAKTDSFNQDFQEMLTEYCWGGSWGRGVLSKQQRSLNNLCMLSALNRPAEFKLHFRGALKNGCSLDCGMPAGVEAFRLAREVLNEDGIKVDE